MLKNNPDIRIDLADRFNALKEHAPADSPDWLFDGIDNAIWLCSSPYNPNNETQDWNDQFFTDDRYPRSLHGGLREACFFMSGYYPLSSIVPCLTKKDQVWLGLDYRVGDLTGQVKGAPLISAGGQIMFDRRWLRTTADELVIVFDKQKVALIGKRLDWMATVDQLVEGYDDPEWFADPANPVPMERSTYSKITVTHQLPEWMRIRGTYDI